ncbi:hypothetical protein [Mesoplasma tabanidae]|uniref:Uncharacterized protein n=1 Tax=Mesoplasma tabanidae TaxID=219745 RepID=A0A2K8P7I4_9MOLU|nr:hypothetical protein [Mesoplasma tabanidae]ATZ21703.1 hypothetical protein MTABA_v1c05050 [Mesoplasma tabanidae]
MKKLLIFLSSLSMTTIISTNIISCALNSENKNGVEKPEEVIDLKSLNINTKLIFSSDIEINEDIVFSELKSINKDLKIKWNNLSIRKNEKYLLYSLDENIYAGTIKLEIIQKTNISELKSEMYLKLAEINEQSLIENFKAINPEVNELKLICKNENENWKIIVSENNKKYDGFIILRIYVKKDIADVMKNKSFKVNSINTHEKIIIKLVKSKYSELIDVKLKANIINKTSWSIIVDESELIYYGNCSIEIYT